jgi:cyclopropane fatty-acyl-phospholipid synthase-like methyltransferase
VKHFTKQFSPACERNQEPILLQLKAILTNSQKVLEIGSGTGQHAVYFSQHLPHLVWQTSDRIENHPSIQAWISENGNARTLAPFVLDVADNVWPVQIYDAVFTANTCHIMHWAEVEKMFAGVSRLLNTTGFFIVYGPFNYEGQFTSISNQEFDASLKRQAIHRGIRDIADLQKLAAQHHLFQEADLEMPANNRLLIFKKSAQIDM